ncbi:MAG: M13 family peptidase [Candidatus Angelobacter sp. Gp1-AA117]|nr:MAG: M13 family peptidase [Candidatus Angelobacter sp. Gp1-AA117]
MKTAKLLIALFILTGIFFAQSATQNPQQQPGKEPGKPKVVPPNKKPAQTPAKTKTEKVLELKGLDPALMDKSADPCADFYQYSCGGWLKQNPVPGDQSSYGRDTELAERNRLILRNILEKASVIRADRSPEEQKIGDFYSSCMDEAAIERKGIAPLKPELDHIAALKSKDDLADLLAHLHLIDAGAFFSFGSNQDFKDATSVIAEADQGGLGLPERDYYTRTDANSEKTRKEYVQHVANMFKLLGDSPQAAAANAKKVMEIETALAKASLTVVQRRDPASIYHKMPLNDLAGMAPAFNWNRYLRATGTPEVQSLNVAVPDFFKGLQTVLQQQDIASIKTYLRWQLVHDAAPMLSKPFVNENFNFFGKKLNGQKELRARWKRCVQATDHNLGEALGKVYAERAFGAEGKARTLAMVKDIESSMERDIKQLTWMTDATKQRALEKLHAVANKIGYPDKWRDYSAYKVVRGDALGNQIRGSEFESHREIAKIGKPVDKLEWGMTPPTVNAYYNPQMNDINFPAGILQPPFYDQRMDDAVNYGDAGGVIGHELTHAFDDEGRQFDPKGNLEDWWTPQDAKEFEERTACIVREYDNFVAVDDVHVQGKLTLGENVADIGGLKLAFMALMQREEESHEQLQPADGFTPAQRFFISYGQGWCENDTPESLRVLAQTNPHAPTKFRVNGVVQNLPEFQQAFSCKAGTPMAPEKRCEVW